MTSYVDFQRAHEIASNICNDDFSLVERNPGMCIRALHVLEDDKAADFSELVHAVYDKVPGLLNYDEEGNWIGPVANENGWTA